MTHRFRLSPRTPSPASLPGRGASTVLPPGDRTRWAALRIAALAAALALGFAAPPAATAQESGDLRIVEFGDVPGYGRLEFYHDGQWGQICDDFFRRRDAKVACRQLGYSGVEEFHARVRGHGPVWLDNVQCKGDEARLEDCPRKYDLDVGEHNCDVYWESTAVRCDRAGTERAVEVRDTDITLNEVQKPTDSYEVRLLQEPSGTVTVTLATTSSAITLSPTSLTFTTSNWGERQAVEVTVVPDATYDDHHATVTHTVTGADYDGIAAPSVAVTVRDPDNRGGEVSPLQITVDEEDAAGTQYAVRLRGRPTGTVTVTVAVPADAPVEVSPTSLTFTTADWDTAQEVTVAAPDDFDIDDETVTLDHSASGGSYETVAFDSVVVTVRDNDQEVRLLTGPPNADTVWWGTLRVGGGFGSQDLLGYLPDLGDGYLSDTDFEYAGATREVLALYLAPGGALNVLLAMGEADALPGTMTLHFGDDLGDDDVLTLADAEHTEHDEDQWRPDFHMYTWQNAQHGIEWETNDVMGVWLEGPSVDSLPGAPTGLDATPVPGGVRLDWDAPSDNGGSPITGYQFQPEDDAGGTRYWWPTRGTATTYTDTVLSTQRVYTFRVRAVNANGNGPPSAPSSAVTPLPVNHPPVGVPRAVGKAAPGKKLWARTAEVEDPNGLTNPRFEYQWMRSDGSGYGKSNGGAQPIPGATDKTYRMQAQDEGTYVTVRVTFTDDDGFTETVESEPRLLREADLAGWMIGVPDEHDGSSAFSVRLRLSERLRAGATPPSAQSFAVVGGAVQAVAATTDTTWTEREWEVTVAPSGDGAVVLSVPLHSDCATPGAICTADQRVLSHAIEHTIAGPVSVSVADARAREGEDEALRFVVTLSRAVDRTVSVDYATADGSAQAGADYEAVSGTLAFAPGETDRAVAVAVLDDLLDEGNETFVLGLSNASGAKLGDDEATGTIENSDPLQQAWLARFGGTVARQVVDAVVARLEGAGGSHVTVAGHGVGSGGDGKEWEDDIGAGAMEAGEARTLTAREAALRSAFRLSSGGGAPGERVWTAWGRMVASGFTSSEGELELDGDMTTGLLGVDVEGARWLAGAALSHARGEGTYGFADGAGTGRDAGEVESTLTSLHPYGRVRLSGDVSAWGVAGYGTGTLTLPEACAGSGDIETDLAMRMGALGVRGALLDGVPEGGLALAVRSDLVWSRTESEPVRSARCGNAEGATARTTQARVVLDGSKTWSLDGPGRTLTPALELGVRHDSGDAGRGMGLEAGVRLAYRDESAGLALEGAVRGLLAHEDGGYEEWGASASAALQSGAHGRGLSLRLAPSFGAASSGVDRLWSASDTRAWVHDAPGGPSGRLEAEVGYGVRGLFGRGVLTPFAGLTVRDGAGRAWRAGGRWEATRRLRMSLEAQRGEHGAADESGNSVMLRGALRW